MKKTLASLFFVLSLGCLEGSAFTVEKFEQDPFDVSAVTYRRVTDSNEEAALVKILLPLKNVEINGNTVGNIEQVSGEYWVYLDPGSISLTLTGSDGKDIEVRFADYGVPAVGKSCTYKLKCKLTDEEQKRVFESKRRVESTEFKTPKHLSVAYKFKGEQHYITHDEWKEQPYGFLMHVDVMGVVIEFEGKKFIYSKFGVIDDNFMSILMDWDKTHEYLRKHPEERLMTKAEAEYVMSVCRGFERGKVLGMGEDYFIPRLPESWLSDEVNENEALAVYGAFDMIGTRKKSQETSVHTVIDIKE